LTAPPRLPTLASRKMPSPREKPPPMTATRENRPGLRRRRLLLALPLLLAACDDTPAPSREFPPLDFGYLLKLRLNVATIDIDDASGPHDTADVEHVEALAPIAPADALRQMAQQRLITAGTSGHAVFVIEEASLTRAPGGFSGAMRVRLDIGTADGAKGGFAEARAIRTYASTDTSEAGTRAALYELVRLMMSDMNIELEYQMKRSLRDYLQSDDGTAPPPPPVQSQDLNPGTEMPGTDHAAPPPAAPPPDQPAPPASPPPVLPPLLPAQPVPLAPAAPPPATLPL
jgi:hypothetical protein